MTQRLGVSERVSLSPACALPGDEPSGGRVPNEDSEEKPSHVCNQPQQAQQPLAQHPFRGHQQHVHADRVRNDPPGVVVNGCCR